MNEVIKINPKEMTRNGFKQKYLIDAFFWINKYNHKKVQDILQDFGIKCHTGKGFINWHEGFVNIVTFQPDKFHDFEYYQKVDTWLPDARYGNPKNIELMRLDYLDLKSSIPSKSGRSLK